MKEMKSKRNKVKSLVGVVCLLLMFIIGNIYPTYIFAQVSESEIETEETRETAVEKDKEEREVRFPNKLEAKEPPSDNQGGSGQSDSINKGIPTSEGSAKADLIENVNNANQDYPIHHRESTGDGSDKYFADARQFITFKTKSGKTFHLIINYDEEGQNVMLLTEVSEDDLLNMVEEKEKTKEEVKKIEELPPQTEATKEELVKEEPKKKEESKGGGLYIFLGLLVTAVAGAGYYFKIYKKKQEESEDDEDYNELEDDYESEDNVEEPEETNEEEEQEEVDDMAIDAYEDEDDE